MIRDPWRGGGGDVEGVGERREQKEEGKTIQFKHNYDIVNPKIGT